MTASPTITPEAAATFQRCEALAAPQGLAVGFRWRGIFRDWEAVYECRQFTFCPCGFTASDLADALGQVEARLRERAERRPEGEANG